jgi:hypothetical protein
MFQIRWAGIFSFEYTDTFLPLSKACRSPSSIRINHEHLSGLDLSLSSSINLILGMKMVEIKKSSISPIDDAWNSVFVWRWIKIRDLELAYSLFRESTLFTSQIIKNILY